MQCSSTELKTTSASAAGPCTRNNDGMKCTKSGYYETIQCDTRGCFCVSADNGLTAFDTRTSNNKTMPKCSDCHNALKSMFADGTPPRGTFIPKCDVVLGNYELLQCGAKREWCYCVDGKTGTEAKGTRKRTGANQYITCGGTNSSINPEEFAFVDAVLQMNERYPVARETCKMNRSKGRSCRGSKPSVRYYFDYDTVACLAFEYMGCGGNVNRYPSSSACYSDCMLADLSGCGGMNPSARTSNGQSIICPKLMLAPGNTPVQSNGPKLNDEGCPLDHTCRMGAFFGTCCTQANEDKYEKAYHPKCSNGHEPYSIQMDGWRRILFGKSCRDNFCPSGYKCEEADIFAYCC
ncbi:hypothetical protein V3C99_014826 [Haemonchus contortus]|uniref:Kunitz/Bovine pancreatic trypsin inhibitor domain protein n=1 Tax=Haemonchus contortus TaxID=6289 RepID=A0A7I4YUF2_HAECO